MSGKSARAKNSLSEADVITQFPNADKPTSIKWFSTVIEFLISEAQQSLEVVSYIEMHIMLIKNDKTSHGFDELWKKYFAKFDTLILFEEFDLFLKHMRDLKFLANISETRVRFPSQSIDASVTTEFLQCLAKTKQLIEKNYAEEDEGEALIKTVTSSEFEQFGGNQIRPSTLGIWKQSTVASKLLCDKLVSFLPKNFAVPISNEKPLFTSIDHSHLLMVREMNEQEEDSLRADLLLYIFANKLKQCDQLYENENTYVFTPTNRVIETIIDEQLVAAYLGTLTTTKRAKDEEYYVVDGYHCDFPVLIKPERCSFESNNQIVSEMFNLNARIWLSGQVEFHNEEVVPKDKSSNRNIEYVIYNNHCKTCRHNMEQLKKIIDSCGNVDKTLAKNDLTAWVKTYWEAPFYKTFRILAKPLFTLLHFETSLLHEFAKKFCSKQCAIKNANKYVLLLCLILGREACSVGVKFQLFADNMTKLTLDVSAPLPSFRAETISGFDYFLLEQLDKKDITQLKWKDLVSEYNCLQNKSVYTSKATQFAMQYGNNLSKVFKKYENDVSKVPDKIDEGSEESLLQQIYLRNVVKFGEAVKHYSTAFSNFKINENYENCFKDPDMDRDAELKEDELVVCKMRELHRVVYEKIDRMVWQLRRDDYIGEENVELEYRYKIDDISQGKDVVAIPATNAVTSDPFDAIIYTCAPRSKLPLQHKQRNHKTEFHCNCKEVCIIGECACRIAHSTVLLNHKGELEFDPEQEDGERMIFECNELCGCAKNCSNRVTQKGPSPDIKIEAYFDPLKYWCVRTCTPISVGSYVGDYIGELLDEKEAQKRGEAYDKEKCSYLFDFMPYDEQVRVTIDSKRYCNWTRFMNHSHDANLIAVTIHLGEADATRSKISFFAVRDISQGEELTFNYGYSANAARVGKQLRCYCNSVNCTGWM